MAPAQTRFFSAQSYVFYFQFTECNSHRAYNAARSLHEDTIGAVLDWLISDCRLFGLTAQNWMWVFPSALLLYMAVLILVRRRHAGTR